MAITLSYNKEVSMEVNNLSKERRSLTNDLLNSKISSGFIFEDAKQTPYLISQTNLIWILIGFIRNICKCNIY